MTDYDVNIEKVLWATIEDYCGLWELVWEINTLGSNNSSRGSQQIALQCVLYLLSRDLLKLFYCQEPYGEMIEIVREDSYADLLKDPKIWEPPLPEARSIRVSATESGEKYYTDMMASKKHQ